MQRCSAESGGWVSATLIAIIISLLSNTATAQYKAGYEMYSERIQKSGLVNAGDSSMVGDQVSLHDGALSFSAQDVVLEGKAAPISVGRKYSAINRRYLGNVGVLGDWELDIPRIEGVFAPNWSGRASSADPNRCSNVGPYPIAEFSPAEWWSGLNLYLTDEDGSGPLLQPTANTQKPTDGATYPLMSSGWSYVSCLPSILNGGGQGFKVVTPSGTIYWFQWMAQYVLPGTAKSSGDSGGAPAKYRLSKRKNVMYVTRIEDRFGNYITYNYSNAWNQAVRLNSINASDGRSITLGYNGSGLLSSVNANGRAWTYGYTTTAGGRSTLSSVGLPDGSAWQLSLAGITDAEVIFLEYANENSCDYLGMPNNAGQEFNGAITHPSGVAANFTVKISAYNRSNVPISCLNVTGNTPYPSSNGNNPADDVNMWPLGYWGLALKSKSLIGSGLNALTWSYQYSSDATAYLAGDATWDFPVCRQGLSCGQPRCITDACAGTSRTTVTAPDGTWTRYVHGNSFKYNDGKLLSIESGAAGSASPMRKTTYTYDFRGTSNRGYLHLFGWAIKSEDDGYMEQLALPIISTQIIQDGVTFNRNVTSFDHFAKPAVIQKYNSLGYTRTDFTEYYDNLARWVIGRIKRQYNANTGLVMERIEYDPNTALPVQVFAFENLQQSMGYHADGQLYTVTDGRNNTTTLTNWKRGVPQNIQYADGTTQSALVNDNGWITAVTDQNGYSTGYGYDAMGRLAGVSYPNEATFTYHNKGVEFRALTASDWRPPGIEVGQWRRYEHEGNRVHLTYYDALWRPVLVHHYDAGNVAATLQSTKTEYDAYGRVTFQSYPTGELVPTAGGVQTAYDALGRTTLVKQDSEHGPLTTTTEYLSGLEVRTTNPRGFQTVNGYQVFDTPSFENLAWSVQPEGKTIQIDRNVFGLPIAFNQRNADSSKSVTRRYVYDGYMQLCKTIEPETGATAIFRNQVGDIQWSASGLSLPSTTNCNLDEAAVSGRVVERRYDARNRMYKMWFPDGRGNQDIEYWPDGLIKKITTYNDSGDGAPVVNDYVYNKRRLLTGENTSQPGWYSWPVGYGYSANADLASQTSPTWLTWTYSPNAIGQATQVMDTNGHVYASGVQYYPNGAISQFTYGNGVVHTMQQNARQLPQRSTDAGIINYSFSYDQNANPNAIYDDQLGAHYSRWMTYDALDRLTDAGSCSFGGDCWHRIRYDALDNITSNTLPGVKDYASYIYDSSNRLTQINNNAGAAALALAYDVQGNLSAKAGQGYVFDFGNRLREVTGKEYYRYDGLGRRVMQWRPSINVALTQYGKNGQIIHIADYAKGKSFDHIYLAGSLLAIREYAHADWSQTVKYQHTDALGSPVAVTNQAGTVLERTQWEPYGAAVNKPNYDGAGYTGHVMDGQTALTYMQQRYYDPSIGRFLSTDPVLADANTGTGSNRYVYASNNPYRFTDPDGRMDRELHEYKREQLVVKQQAWDSEVERLRGVESRGVEAVYPEANFVAPLRALSGANTAITRISRVVESGRQSGGRTSGRYEFPDKKNGDKPYVGQSCNCERRLGDHKASGRYEPGTASVTPVAGGKTAREISEHRRIQEITGGVPARNSDAVSNKVDPIGPGRRHLLETK